MEQLKCHYLVQPPLLLIYLGRRYRVGLIVFALKKFEQNKFCNCTASTAQKCILIAN